ncbi:vesicle transport protein, putative [Babesia bigemina]|uniref:Vesicle-trafficking protein SEC22b n=1 Tax=Babesia bigemina TaxID=5866 RepID=A0A061D448_BABBI|nr:vesicle transport protein, putative [Babesia bigemina]CDR95343.1 vesicle transport protein, putative [Babesia bigemina]|eukprot:XP_012767529.1 vesicle transport protein, putative [Babesia bigemina]
MGDLTLLCRASDGLPLVEIWEDRISPESLDLNSNEVSKVTQSIKINARMICRKLPPNSTKCSIMEGDVCYHYMVEGGICYMTVTSTEYPKKLAFLYLAELCAAFEKELETQRKSHSPNDPLRAIAKPYSFMTFDRTIHKIKANFKDPNSSKALHMINNSLNEVTNIMRRNIDEILQRGENLEDIGRMADGLKAETLKFKTSSKLLAQQSLLEKYLVFVIVAVVIIMCYYFAFGSTKGTT